MNDIKKDLSIPDPIKEAYKALHDLQEALKAVKEIKIDWEYRYGRVEEMEDDIRVGSQRMQQDFDLYFGPHYDALFEAYGEIEE